MHQLRDKTAKALILFKEKLSFINIILILFISFAFLIYSPSFKLNFSLLDDGLTILNKRTLITSFEHADLNGAYNVFFEPVNGRVRPGYWLVQSIFAIISFENPNLFHILRFTLLLGTFYLVYKFLKKFNIKPVFIIYSLFIFLFNIQNFENYYRLGPVEPFLIIILVGIYYLVFANNKLNIKQKIFLAGIVLLGGLIKENFFLIGLSFIPILSVAKLQKNKALSNKSLVVLASCFAAALLVFLMKRSYGGAGVYAANYIFSLQQIIINFINYVFLLRFHQSLVFEISFIYLLFIVVQIFLRGKRMLYLIKTNELVLLIVWSQVFIQILALSPWSFVLNRYLGFININLAIIYAITFNGIYEFVLVRTLRFKERQVKPIFALFLIILVMQIVVRNLFNIANYQLYAKTDSDISFGSVRDLAINIPENGNVFVNYKKGDSNIEIFEETKWQLNLFYKRPDINFIYLDDANLCTRYDRFIFDRRSDRFTNEAEFTGNPNYTILLSDKSSYTPINYGNVLRSFKDRYKYLNWSDKYDFDWRIIKQKGGSCVQKK